MMRKSQYGVTIIELAIGLVIFGVLAAVAIPSFKDWLQNSQVRTATESLNEGLQLARAEAVRVNGPVAFTVDSVNGAAWTISTLNVNDLSALAAVQSRSATETSNALVTASGTTVCFNGTGQQVVAAAGVCPVRSTVTFDVSNPAGGACVATGPVRCLRVVVRTGGQIRMCDPALPNTDTQSC
ncbi:MAG: GspH/FimT family pseudopilin [Betaproteobacteria bacterium]